MCLNLVPPHTFTYFFIAKHRVLNIEHEPQIFLSFQVPVLLQSLEISNQISHKQFHIKVTNNPFGPPQQKENKEM